MEDTVQQAKAEFIRAKQRVSRALDTTSDDRLNWSPSPTARTPIQEVAHAGLVIDIFRGVLAGRPHQFESVFNDESLMRADEKQFTTRNDVIGLLDHNSAEYIAWLDALTPDKLAGAVETPFGSLPMTFAITVLAEHLRGHAAQIDYIQTIYGDHDWHLPS